MKLETKPKNRAPLILFEGIDFSGKTTMITKLQEYFSDKFVNVKVYNEPTSLNDIRSLVLDKNKKKEFFGNSLPEKQEIIDYYLFMASRAHLFFQVTKDLKNNIPVFLDRDFISSFVYQNEITKVGTKLAYDLSPLRIESILSKTGVNPVFANTELNPAYTDLNPFLESDRVKSLYPELNTYSLSFLRKDLRYLKSLVLNMTCYYSLYAKKTRLSERSKKIDILDDTLKLYNYFSCVNNFTDELNGPDLILFFDIHMNTFMDRKNLRSEINHYDNESYSKILNRIVLYRKCFTLIKKSKKMTSKIVRIDANRDKNQVFEECVEIVSSYLLGCKNTSNLKDGVELYE